MLTLRLRAGTVVCFFAMTFDINSYALNITRLVSLFAAPFKVHARLRQVCMQYPVDNDFLGVI